MPEGIKYHIIRADKAGCPAIPDLIYDDPAEAAKAAKKLTLEMGEKLAVKMILDNKWKEREMMRRAHGTYRPLPWERYEWWQRSAMIHQHHFAHPSVEKPGWLAYTKNAEDGMRDKQTVVRPGSYLREYFKFELDRYGESERRMVDVFTAAFGPIEVKFATTAEEIVSVYERGPDTCMKGRDWPNDGRNPAWVYAAGDLQVAYLGELTNAKARTLVWPEKKIFSRVYGDIARLTNGLERLGYKWGAPIGAKLSKVKLREVKFDPRKGPPTACFLAPYIDKKNQSGGGHLSVLDKDTHLEICEEGVPGSHHCGLPDGHSGQYVPRADEYPTFTCKRCETPGFPELRIVNLDADCEQQESWCGRCVKAAAFRCGYSGENFSKGDVERIIVEGDYWTQRYADMYAEECEATGNLTNTGNLINVTMPDGVAKRVSSHWAKERGLFRSNLSRKYFLQDSLVYVRSDEYGQRAAGKPEAKYHAFECDGCQTHWMLDERTEKDDKLICPNCIRGKPKKAKVASVSDQQLYQQLAQAEAQAQYNDPFRVAPGGMMPMPNARFR